MRIIAVGVVLLFWTTAFAADGPAKKRVAVFDFDNAAAQGGMSSPLFQTIAPNLGKAVADLVVSHLVKAGSVSVIERGAIDKLLTEQNLTNSDRTDPQTAAKLGRILGVDAIILGAITHYDYDDKVTGTSHSALSALGHPSMSTKHDIKAHVQITARLVSPDTAEVLAVAEGVGDINRKGVKVDIRDNSKLVAMMGGNANNSVLTEATDLAIAHLGAELELKFPKLPPRTPVIEGQVADANDSGRLVLNVGAQQGVKPGDRLQVWRQGKEIKDPETGKVLLRDDLLLGEAVVNSVSDAFSIAVYQGPEPAKTGDRVKTPHK